MRKIPAVRESLQSRLAVRLLLVLAAASWASAFAQPPTDSAVAPPDDPTPRAAPPPHDRPPGEPPPGAHPPPGRFGGPPFGGPPGPPFDGPPPGLFRRFDNPMNLFRPVPADGRPPARGEVDALIDLAIEKVPRLGRRLRATREQRPFLFERRFAREFLPILRQLKRLYAEDEKLADTYRDHWQLNFEFRQLRGRWADAPKPQQERIEGEARKLFASMIRLETRVAEHELQKRESNPDQIIGLRFDEVLSPDYDPIAEPPPLREAIRAVRAAKSDEAREQARTELRARIRRAIHMEIRALRDLRNRLQARADEEVDHRIARLKHFPHAPPGPIPDSNPASDPAGR